VRKVYTESGKRWQVAMAVSEGQFQQVSFVNSIYTMHGGTHVVRKNTGLLAVFVFAEGRMW
jgi:DNA gyrase/topoisomerase IV subunit B